MDPPSGSPGQGSASQSRQLGKYDLLGRIGYGGMAEVWLAKQRGPMGFEKLVAIKKLLPHLQAEEQFVRMFLDEARIAARINHTNVVQIFDLGQAESSFFIAMEYLNGESLARVMGEGVRRGTPLPEALGALIVAQIGKGLHHAHALCDAHGNSMGIVHRDVSPQNVVVLYDGGVKLLDFGIAKARERLQETTTSGLKGKYAYMSPEQCSGEAVDARSDIFSCGVLLWEILTRRRLFKHSNKLMVLKMILEGHVAPPSRVNPGVPSALDRVVLQALAKRAEDRFPSADAMSTAIEGALAASGAAVNPAQVAEYMRTAFADDLRKRNELAANLSASETSLATQDPAEWLELMPEASHEIISFSKSPVVPTARGGAEPARSNTVWWMVTAIIATLAAAITIFTLLWVIPGSGNREPRLVVESSPPGASILIDGKLREERAPATIATPEGDHTVEVALAGHRPWRRSVTLGAGETLRVEAALQLLASTARPRRDAGAPELARDGLSARDRSSRVSPDLRRGPEPAVASVGTLHLATRPWATIYHGKRRLGDTPLVGVKLPAGSVKLTAVNDEEKIRISFTVQIKKGQILRQQVDLRRPR
jgi:serine/threonine-protein kinase